jgi:methyltransferase (TIGR00027 family)
MAKSDRESVSSGVGATALLVANGRALESRRADGLVYDAYAAAFAAASDTPEAGVGPLPSGDVPERDSPWESIASYVGVRSRYFDRYFSRVNKAGLTQVVLMAAGLDTRAYRLDWPPDCIVYEIDQAGVLQFKDEVLRNEQAQPRCERRTVSADLRLDWTAALSGAGFDSGTPTAWLMEGLLAYLSAEAEDLLFSRIRELSAPGSMISLEQADVAGRKVFEDSASHHRAQAATDAAGLWQTDARPETVDVLRSAGWTVDARPFLGVASEYGRRIPGLMGQTAAHTSLLTARLEFAIS